MDVIFRHTENYKCKQYTSQSIITTYLLHQRQWDVQVEYSLHFEYQPAFLLLHSLLSVSLPSLAILVVNMM